MQLAVAFHFTKVVGRDELLEELHFLLFKRKGTVIDKAHPLGVLVVVNSVGTDRFISEAAIYGR